jgi:hypothetical protein
MNETASQAVVITGIGIISTFGTRKEEFFRALRTANAEKARDTRSKTAETGNLVDALNIEDPSFKISRYLDPVSKNTIVAVGNALTDAGIDRQEISDAPYDYAVLLGTVHGPSATRAKVRQSLAARQGRMISGTLFSHCGYNIAGASAAIVYGLRGPNLTLCGKSDLGISLLNRAMQLLKSRRAHTVLVGYSECEAQEPNDNGGPLNESAYVMCLQHENRVATSRRKRPMVELEQETMALPTGSSPLLLSGSVYELRETGKYPGVFEKLQVAGRLGLEIAKDIKVREEYAPLLQIGMIIDAFESKHIYSSCALITQVRHGVSILTLRSKM